MDYFNTLLYENPIYVIVLIWGSTLLLVMVLFFIARWLKKQE